MRKFGCLHLDHLKSHKKNDKYYAIAQNEDTEETFLKKHADDPAYCKKIVRGSFFCYTEDWDQKKELQLRELLRQKVKILKRKKKVSINIPENPSRNEEAYPRFGIKFITYNEFKNLG